MSPTFHWLNAKEPISDELRSRFAAADLLPLCDAFIAVAEHIIERPFPRDRSCDQARAWAEQTLAFLARPNVHRRAHVLRIILHYPRRFLGDKAVRQQYLRDMFRPETLRDFLRRHLDAIRGYQ